MLPLIHIDQLAKDLQLERRWIFENWITRDVDPCPHFRDGKSIFFNLEELNQWTKQRSGTSVTREAEKPAQRKQRAKSREITASFDHDGVFDSGKAYSHKAIARILGKKDRWVIQEMILNGVAFKKLGNLQMVSGHDLVLWIRKNSSEHSTNEG